MCGKTVCQFLLNFSDEYFFIPLTHPCGTFRHFGQGCLVLLYLIISTLEVEAIGLGDGKTAGMTFPGSGT